jgi:uncharacterized protein
MQILVDADACPVVNIIERIGEKYQLAVVLLCDTNHQISSEYSEVKVIGAGADAVDFALVNLCKKGDIVVTQDYGVAAMALGKGALGIHQSGKYYTHENIDQLLMERHFRKEARRASTKHHMKGPKKRTIDDDKKFEIALVKLVESQL